MMCGSYSSWEAPTDHFEERGLPLLPLGEKPSVRAISTLWENPFLYAELQRGSRTFFGTSGMADDRLASHACASTIEVQKQQRRGIQTGTSSNERREIRLLFQLASKWVALRPPILRVSAWVVLWPSFKAFCLYGVNARWSLSDQNQEESKIWLFILMKTLPFLGAKLFYNDYRNISIMNKKKSRNENPTKSPRFPPRDPTIPEKS